MAHRIRQVRDAMEPRAHPQARQQPSQTSSGSRSSTLPPQPTAFVALPKTFTPPGTCSEHRLSMMLPRFFVWANEPIISDGVTASACYPSEFLKLYHSVPSTLGGTDVGSSIAPAMSPLVCPANFCTASASGSYLVCCPSGYLFHPPGTIVDTKRPAYGGTCYSEIPPGTSLSVTQYSLGTSNGVIPYPGSTTAQAYGHPIDGFAINGETPVVGCQSPVPLSSAFAPRSSSLSSTSLSSIPASTTPSSSSGSKISAAAIAGVSIGGFSFLAAIIFFTWFILRYMRTRRKATARPTIYHVDHINAKLNEDIPVAGSNDRYEIEGRTCYELGTPGKPGEEKFGASRLNNVNGAYEMHGDQVPELDGGHGAKKSKTVPPGYAS